MHPSETEGIEGVRFTVIGGQDFVGAAQCLELIPPSRSAPSTWPFLLLVPAAAPRRRRPLLPSFVLVHLGSSHISPWIDPAVLYLKHRIGRCPFVYDWIPEAECYDLYHEFDMKMLQPVRDDQLHVFLARFNEVFRKCRCLDNVCFLHGISTHNGRLCVAMRFSQGSIGDRMARLKGGRLPLSDVLRGKYTHFKMKSHLSMQFATFYQLCAERVV